MNKLTEIPLMLFLLSFAILISLSCVSAASTVYVNSTGDDINGNGSAENPYQTISKGISTVDDNGTVQIADGKYSGTGNTNLTISRNMIITGQNQKKTIINGTGANWIFMINYGVTVTITNLTLTNATKTVNGGAIYNMGNLNVSNCTFTGNTARCGGAIYNYGSIGCVSGCTFTGNTAREVGGAIYNYGSIGSVSGCTFTGNTAAGAGAIFNVGSIGCVSGCTFTGNTALGGAIMNLGSIGCVSGCTFTGNIATDNGDGNWNGGAIYNNGTITTISGCTFTGNIAQSGFGGALYNNGNLSVSNCTFTGNDATCGGAIANSDIITSLSGCTLTDNTATSNSYLGGGAILNYGGTITTINGCNFTGNNGVYGGGAILNYEGNVTSLSDCTFMNNTATAAGGAITNIGNMTVNGCTFIGNKITGTNYGGGAIYNQYYDISVHFSRFLNSTATNGKDIYCMNYEIGSVDAKYNWWGSNSDPSSGIYGNVDVSPWLVLSISADPTEIFNTKTSKVTVDLYKDSDNGDHSSEYAKYPSEIPLTFTTTWGSITQSVLAYGNGTAIFTANGGSIPQQNPVTIYAADSLNQTATVSTNITIKPVANLYINTTSSSKNPKIGDIFKITYKLGNKGPDDAKNVTITFQIPEGLDFVNISVDSGKCSYDKTTRTVTWTLDSVPVGDPYLYLTVKAAGDGTYKITPNVTSETYNLNSGDFGIITFNIQPNSNNNPNNNENTVNAASKTTIELQETGIPINYIILAVLMVLSGLVVPKRK